MKFVGGPMHGLPVPEELAYTQINGNQVYAVVEMIGEYRRHTYMLSYWFYRPDRPVIRYLLWMGDWAGDGGGKIDHDGWRREQAQLRACREVLPC